MRFGLSFFVIIIALIMVIGIEQNPDLGDSDIDRIFNYTQFSSSIEKKEFNPTNYSIQHSVSILVYKAIDLGLFAFLEVERIFSHWAYQNRDWVNATLLLWLFIIAALAALIVPLIKIVIIATIFIRELITSRKEKRELTKLRRLKNVRKRTKIP